MGRIVRELPQRKALLAGLVGMVLLGCLSAGGVFALANGLLDRGGGGGDETPPAQGALVDLANTPTQAAAGILATTQAPLPTSTSTLPPTATRTPRPTATPNPTRTPRPTATTPAGPYVMIEDISIANGYYIVEYETYGYTEQLPGTHIHFFYDTVTPVNAGSPNSGPWYLWGGPRPFDKYALSSRPAAATQLCALVANPDHSIILETGNCVNLP